MLLYLQVVARHSDRRSSKYTLTKVCRIVTQAFSLSRLTKVFRIVTQAFSLSRLTNVCRIVTRASSLSRLTNVCRIVTQAFSLSRLTNVCRIVTQAFSLSRLSPRIIPLPTLPRLGMMQVSDCRYSDSICLVTMKHEIVILSHPVISVVHSTLRL